MSAGISAGRGLLLLVKINSGGLLRARGEGSSASPLLPVLR